MLSRNLLSKLISGTLKGALSTQQTVKMSSVPTYKTLKIEIPKEYVYHVQLNRPEKLNAFNNDLFMELGACFKELDENENCRVVILSANGKVFSAGLDFESAMEVGQLLAEVSDTARKAKILLRHIKDYQAQITSLEQCKKPVLCALHSACIGAGVDLASAADIRYSSKDAYFSIREVDIGMAADVGTLQRFPKTVSSDSWAREVCYTARKFDAEEALRYGFVHKVFENKESLIGNILKLAEEISKKSPVAVQGTKASLIYSRDHTVQEGLDHIANWNQLMLQSEDFMTATVAAATKQKEVLFSKL